MAAARIHHRARPWRHAAAAVLGVSWALASHAESPMLTDDAGTLDAGGFKIEARHTWDALARSEGNISNTARLLGISRPTLYDLLKQYDMQN